MNIMNTINRNIKLDLKEIPKIDEHVDTVLNYKPKSKHSMYYVCDAKEDEVFTLSFNGSEELKDLPELLIVINKSENDVEFNITKNYMHIMTLRLLFTTDHTYKFKYKTWNCAGYTKDTEYMTGLFRRLNVPPNSMWLWEVLKNYQT